ncbi:hypothetical protein Taro_012140 [Colocasia esculenta]|uniref:Uncharacterized protein n=1 Tax=Colocasia esculenta TaxID=4460 RepID=A0A843UCQ2_COLES|nr:hypothetical protein [Colocasia esculenta]
MRGKRGLGSDAELFVELSCLVVSSVRPQLGQAAVLHVLCVAALSRPRAGAEAGARLASRACGLWVPLLAASGGGLVVVVVTAFSSRRFQVFLIAQACAVVIARLCLVSMGIVGLALGRPVLLVVPASVFSRFCGPVLGCVEHYFRFVPDSVGFYGSRLGAHRRGSSVSDGLRRRLWCLVVVSNSESERCVQLPCMIRTHVAGCSCCCAACGASVVARCVHVVGARLALDSVAVVFLVWRTLASQSRIAPCRFWFWWKFFPGVLYVSGGESFLLAVVLLWPLVHLGCTLFTFGVYAPGACDSTLCCPVCLFVWFVHCFTSLLGVGGFEFSASGIREEEGRAWCLGVVERPWSEEEVFIPTRRALRGSVLRLSPELRIPLVCLSTGVTTARRVATSEEASALSGFAVMTRFPDATRLLSRSHYPSRWYRDDHGGCDRTCVASEVFVAGLCVGVCLRAGFALRTFWTPVLGSLLREYSGTRACSSLGRRGVRSAFLAQTRQSLVSLPLSALVPEPCSGVKREATTWPGCGVACVVCSVAALSRPCAGAEAGVRLASRACGLRVPLLVSSGSGLVVVVVTAFSSERFQVFLVARACTVVIARLCLVSVGVISLALGRLVLLVVPASVFSRFRGPVLGCAEHCFRFVPDSVGFCGSSVFPTALAGEGLVIPTGPCSRGSPPYFLQLEARRRGSSVSDRLRRRLWCRVVVSSSESERCELL